MKTFLFHYFLHMYFKNKLYICIFIIAFELLLFLPCAHQISAHRPASLIINTQTHSRGVFTRSQTPAQRNAKIFTNSHAKGAARYTSPPPTQRKKTSPRSIFFLLFQLPSSLNFTLRAPDFKYKPEYTYTQRILLV